jgi:hypothetical protein
MTRVFIHGGPVDVLCSCGQPKTKSEPLAYGFRMWFMCDDCDLDVAIDVIE